MSTSGQDPVQSAGTGTTGASGASSRRPGVVDLSFWLWIASVVIGLVSTAVLLLVQRDAVLAQGVEAARQADPTLDPAAAEQTVSLGLVVGAVIAVVLVVAQLVLALLMRRGRNWARIVLTVLTVLTVLALPLSLPASTSLGIAASILQVLLVIVATVLMFLPRANPWFRAPNPR